MNLYFLRHAKAHPRGPKFRPDSKRPLTRDGEEKMRGVARGLKKMGLTFDLILTSPYARALRTAEILAEVYNSQKTFATNNLTPDASPKDLVNEINENFSALENICLVGHEPQMSGMISLLLAGNSAISIDLKKAGLCHLTVNTLSADKCATLIWLLKPGQLEEMG